MMNNIMEDNNQMQYENEYPSYNNLPDIILLKILNYLDDVDDMFNAAWVCTRWNHLTKSYSLWRQRQIVEIDVKAIKKSLPKSVCALLNSIAPIGLHVFRPHQVVETELKAMKKLVTLLPKSITRLDIIYGKNKYMKLPMNWNQIVKYLRSFCPELESLSIENALIESSQHLLNEILQHSPNILLLPNCVFHVFEYWLGQNLPTNLEAKITVLDLTSTKNFGELYLRCFCSFPDLQELYLGDSDFSDDEICHILELCSTDSLRVLNVEKTSVGYKTIFAIKHMETLTTLYMGHTRITDMGFRAIFENDSFLPQLQTLCVRNSRISSACIEEFLSKSKRSKIEVSWSFSSDESILPKQCNHSEVKLKSCDNSCHIELA